MAQKKISIIIPCYNVEAYIDRCFESLAAQTIGLAAMELIFVDDASTDATLEKLTALEKQYPEDILVIQFPENQRQGTARNVALEYASAPYIGYVDADDWVEPDMYEKLLDLMERYHCDFVECRWDYARDPLHCQPTKSWGKTGYMDLTDRRTKQEFIASKVALVSPWDKVFRKDFLTGNNIFFPEKILNEDIFFVYLSFIYAQSYYYLDEVLYHYFVNPKGTVRQKKAEYQLDKMTVTYGFLEECNARGLLESNREDIDWLFLERYYVYMLWEIFQEFPERSYELYLEMKETIREWIPDYRTNCYRKWPGNEFDDMMLKLLDYNMDSQQFEKIRCQMLDQIASRDAQEF